MSDSNENMLHSTASQHFNANTLSPPVVSSLGSKLVGNSEGLSGDESSNEVASSGECDESEETMDRPRLPPVSRQTTSPSISGTMDTKLYQDKGEESSYKAHMKLLQTATESQSTHEVGGTPVFTNAVIRNFPNLFTQYGFFAGVSKVLDQDPLVLLPSLSYDDPRLFFNIAAPSSVFICGSQGSGKSHTLSCLLENYLVKSAASNLDHPLSALLFHYDQFTSDAGGAPCEAAYLSSNPKIKVRVLCSPSNMATIARTYARLEVSIEALCINQSDLDTQRMMDLMAVNTEDGSMPLYLRSITQILRSMRIVQQEKQSSFNYAEFKQKVMSSGMTPHQLVPLNQRLDILESFMPQSQVKIPQPAVKKWKGSKIAEKGGNDWTIRAGTLTIVDLSCPCVTADEASALFNMCLHLFLQQNTNIGRVIALDEAHKYMTAKTEVSSLTSTLLDIIRLQRHLGARIIISTQEPTISPTLLDLCSSTIVHRFTSPAWLATLKSHLAAFSQDDGGQFNAQSRDKLKSSIIFKQILKLRVGEALLFSPSAIVEVARRDGEAEVELKRLGTSYMKIKVRARVTSDGGKSVMAT